MFRLARDPDGVRTGSGSAGRTSRASRELKDTGAGVRGFAVAGTGTSRPSRHSSSSAGGVAAAAAAAAAAVAAAAAMALSAGGSYIDQLDQNLGPGDVVGERSLFTGEAAEGDVVAVSPVITAVIPMSSDRGGGGGGGGGGRGSGGGGGSGGGVGGGARKSISNRREKRDGKQGGGGGSARHSNGGDVAISADANADDDTDADASPSINTRHDRNSAPGGCVFLSLFDSLVPHIRPKLHALVAHRALRRYPAFQVHP